MKVKFIDPPEGWRYGFPKVIPDDVVDIKQWFLDQGYPEKHIELALKYSRFWIKDIEEKDETN